jgi:hypothetical protein
VLTTRSFGLLAGGLRVLAQGLLTTVAATGLLYLLRAHLPPAPLPIHDAIPLDELPGHDTVPLFVLALAWALAAAAVLLLSGTRRESPPLAFAAATIGCAFASCALSLQIVRQITTVEALTAAAVAPAVYIEGLIAALAAMLTSRMTASRRSHPPRAPTATTNLTR